jgi:hypothetical protein
MKIGILAMKGTNWNLAYKSGLIKSLGIIYLKIRIV